MLLILFLVGVATGSKLAEKPMLGLLLASPIGLVACGCWSAAIFFTARNDWGVLVLPLVASTPLCFAFPALDIAFGAASPTALPSNVV